ncbi:MULTISPECIES: UDP-N-acetylmuramate dehydrogenase [Mesonia]|uniref:UDP-N-acetylenolpyruvoylglucosamine reductase n=1 Tax=Mesonia oceanica TaxID=2687242 RepID=A0AC61Y6L4_9FLAO|nr:MULTISPECIES: UDP-N-acetylmuramate dehydrogenase [Mesonia]MAN26285.1 UDP-N-acetylenolpyruvoylglucosamine reductase [Mesonia sp.]MAQ42155.1 UDP-N-acetylenolpyruvoylglucosamine reductase [Mesonia sp.]MBJ97975.1 UDP-N-acetylenolpyruvoylglucosamine reductase [Flavobacteriaceae bacterium]VVV00146.1 UDP-N-acetylenolpyruvoylglucosamine reductase [Mesonia oceanica]|tara:strand:+ start:6461 stop:7477 length:1017 start_codon:yes stop_codon:yes gene_type:complete
MQQEHNFSLKAYNTFGLAIKAKSFIEVGNEEELEKVLRKVYSSELFVLGGGSNCLFTKDFDGTVLHLNIKGKEIVNETEDEVFLKVNAGENWHQLVLFCVENNYGGIENLSLIPGNVGTSPIQNIGAYGVELKDVFVECEAIHIQTLEKKVFTKEDCQFGYRNSVFKNEVKGQYIITSVTFQLSKKNHQLKTDYGAILNELDKKGISKPTIKDVSDVIISIRERKLPNPKEIGNSGSFFKNPIISISAFEKLQEKYPEIPSYKISEAEVKVPAGWLIDQAGFKGYRNGDAGVHKNQALVLVNYGNATGEEIFELAEFIQEKIKKKFEVDLEMEVNIIS